MTHDEHHEDRPFGQGSASPAGGTGTGAIGHGPWTLYGCPACGLVKLDGAQMVAHSQTCGGEFQPFEAVSKDALTAAYRICGPDDLAADIEKALGLYPDIHGSNPLGGASRGVGRCTCPCGKGTDPGCQVHP